MKQNATLRNVAQTGEIAMKEGTRITKMAKIIDLDQTSTTEEKVARIIQNKKEVSYQSIMDELKSTESLELSKPTISRKVRSLEKEGLVIKKTVDKKIIVKWVGGTPALEQELIGATQKHTRASILAENYDMMVSNAFSLFSLLFEDGYWEVIMNLKEGLNDTELHQRLGNDIPLDSIRRILVTSDVHDLVKIKRIRSVSGNDQIRLTEPLYRIDSVNKQYLEYFIIIRGLASAAIARMGGEISEGYTHLYDGLLDAIVLMFLSLRDKATSNQNEADNEILAKMLMNYDFAPDLDRAYKQENWRKSLKGIGNVKIDDKAERLIIRQALSERYRMSMIERVTKK